MMPRLPVWFGDTVTIVRPGTRIDRYGDEVPDPDNPVEVVIEHCKVNPAAGQEDPGRLDDRAALTRRWVMAAPPDADIRHSDRIRWQDDEYEVEGEVLRWKSPTGAVDHLYVQLVRVEG